MSGLPPSERPVRNVEVESSFEAALGGDRDAVRRFFEGVRLGPLYVPDRYQERQLSDAPPYPNDLVHVLGIQDKERVIIPAFTAPDMIEQWCGIPLACKSFTGRTLADAAPEGWWVCINPGTGIEKDLSPWELEQIRGGELELASLVEENFPQTMSEPLSIEQVGAGEFTELRVAAAGYASERPQITQLLLLKENGLDLDENPVVRLLLGAVIAPSAAGEVQALSDELRAVASRAQIGGDEPRVFMSANGIEGLLFDAFRDVEPFYDVGGTSISKRFKRLLSPFKRSR